MQDIRVPAPVGCASTAFNSLMLVLGFDVSHYYEKKNEIEEEQI